MKNRLSEKIRLRHILDAIGEVQKYVKKIDYDSFAENSMMIYACVKQLEIIGEAASHVSGKTRKQFPQIEWKEIIGLRNILVHEYFGVDKKIVWDIIKDNLPNLKQDIKKMLSKLEDL